MYAKKNIIKNIYTWFERSFQSWTLLRLLSGPITCPRRYWSCACLRFSKLFLVGSWRRSIYSRSCSLMCSFWFIATFIVIVAGLITLSFATLMWGCYLDCLGHCYFVNKAFFIFLYIFLVCFSFLLLFIWNCQSMSNQLNKNNCISFFYYFIL